MMGPLAPAGALWEDAHMLDVAPTIQALMGVSPAEDLTGRVLLGEASEDGWPRSPRRTRWMGKAGSGRGSGALRALGYAE